MHSCFHIALVHRISGTNRVTAESGLESTLVLSGAQWCSVLMTRAEGQFRRDLTLPFALWNLTFRTVINIGHNTHSIKLAAANTKYTAGEFAEDAENISSALAGRNVQVRFGFDNACEWRHQEAAKCT